MDYYQRKQILHACLFPLLRTYFRKLRLNNAQLSCDPEEIPIDVVIPAASKDFDMLPLVVTSIRRFIRHRIDKIYIVALSSPDVIRVCNDLHCVLIEEREVFPFSKSDIGYIYKGKDRSGWLLQQLIKLNSDTLCTNDLVLVADADTVFIDDHIFYTDVPIFRFSHKYYVPFFKTYEKLFKQKPKSIVSFISHSMLFERHVLINLRSEVGRLNSTTWDGAILAAMDLNEKAYFSEYETYGNFIRNSYSSRMALTYANNLTIPKHPAMSLDELLVKYRPIAKSVSMHTFDR